MVAKLVVETLVCPPAPVAVTFTVYCSSNRSGWDGTQELPSGRMPPGNVSPSALVRVTEVTVPLVTSVPISAEIGTRLASAAGVTVRDGAGAAVAAMRARARVEADRRSVGRVSAMGPSLAPYVIFVGKSCLIRIPTGEE